jgi:sarcosine oxidase subunit alpha
VSGRADRSGRRLGASTVRFRFDGREFAGREGDTMASALLANGVRLLGRSIKYRRPRGVVTADWDEPNALLTLATTGGDIPNLPAGVLPIANGRELESQNRWPSLRHDLAALIGLGSRLLGAGFYYKTFMWPSWRTYEHAIRRLAGFGAAPGRCVANAPRSEYLHCDVLIVGGGAAGLAAAQAATVSGARVVVCEREPECGGELDFEVASIDGVDARTWIDRSLAALRDAGARVLTDTAVVARSGGIVYAHGVADGQTASVSLRIAAREVVMATGAAERPIAFVDNDRPGVMLLGAAERLLARYGVQAGRQVVLFGNNDRLYPAAVRLRASGIRIAGIVDVRPPSPGAAIAALRERLAGDRVECLSSHAVTAARGRYGVQAAEVESLDAAGAVRRIACDAILVSGGWTPTGTRTEMHGIDATSHDHSLAGALEAGWRAGMIAAGVPGEGESSRRHVAGPARGTPVRARDVSGDPAPHPRPFARSPAARHDEKRQFVDFQNDVTVADLRQALTEGFREIEHVKRYTTLGTGTDQGRLGGALGAAILAELEGRDAAQAVTSNTRAPLQPTTLHVLAGRNRGAELRPSRMTPLHDWHVANRALMESMGSWLRPRGYAANGTSPGAAGVVEAARVRSRGGILDGSTLGKIEIAGPAAADFLDRLYLTRGSTLREGRARYMVLLREDGMVLDDGLVLRLGAEHFVATVSSGHAQHVLSHLEYYRDLEFAARGVALADVTEAWAVIVVAGPASPGALTQVLGAEWISAVAGLAHMEHFAARWHDAGLRVLRASFSGELAYELHCRPRIAPALWEALVATGLEPYGLEALDILRVEKGYLTGAEMNGQTTPMDLGLGSFVARNPGAVGADLLDRPAFGEPQRPRLVGVQSIEPTAPLLAGAQLTVDARAARACGHVTSGCWSPALDRHLGLALVARELPIGAELVARDPLRSLESRVRLTMPVHFDAGGARMRS